jgi:hypothetical protein
VRQNVAHLSANELLQSLRDAGLSPIVVFVQQGEQVRTDKRTPWEMTALHISWDQVYESQNLPKKAIRAKGRK